MTPIAKNLVVCSNFVYGPKYIKFRRRAEPFQKVLHDCIFSGTEADIYGCFW